MRTVTLEELLEAGCHFGHQVNRRNPKADEYIFEARNGVHIINLENTRDGLMTAAEYVADLASKGGSLLVVGTKRQCKSIIDEEIARAKEAGAGNLFYITTRWIGGILTNSGEVSKNYKRLKDLEVFLKGNHEGYTKKEALLMEREKNKLNTFYAGVVDLKRNPDAIFIIDTHTEHTAVGEALKTHVPIIGITDTNADPTEVNYPIPSNDDAVGAIKLITHFLIDAWIEGSKKAKREEDRAKAAEEGKKDTNKKTDEKKSVAKSKDK